jgi:uncharacterized protein
VIKRLTIHGCLAISLLAGSLALRAAEVMPPKLARYFNDAAAVVPREVGDRLNEQLAQYERESSNQLVVAIYPRMLTDSSLEDYATRVFQSWGIGQKGRNNGAVLFVFVQDRKMRIQTGYGLEASLTDAESFRIIEEMKPWLRRGDYAGGLSLAVKAMIQATQGEYQGTGKTKAEQSQQRNQSWFGLAIFGIVFVIFFINFLIAVRRLRKGMVYQQNGRLTLPGESSWLDTIGTSMSSGSGSSWSSGGGGFSSSDFSGGGGSTGGGGASGSW